MKWAIKTKAGNFVSYFTAVFNPDPRVVVTQWDTVAIFIRRTDAKTAIKAMGENGIDADGMKPVKVVQKVVLA